LFDDAIYLAIMKKNIEEAGAIVGEDQQLTAFANIADELCNGHYFEEAEEILKMTLSDRNKSYICSIIIRQLIEVGQIDHAIALAQQLTNEFYRSCNYEDISRLLLKKGDSDKAIEVAYKISHHTHFVQKEQLMKEFLRKGDLDKAIKF